MSYCNISFHFGIIKVFLIGFKNQLQSVFSGNSENDTKVYVNIFRGYKT